MIGANNRILSLSIDGHGNGSRLVFQFSRLPDIKPDTARLTPASFALTDRLPFILIILIVIIQYLVHKILNQPCMHAIGYFSDVSQTRGILYTK